MKRSYCDRCKKETSVQNVALTKYYYAPEHDGYVDLCDTCIEIVKRSMRNESASDIVIERNRDMLLQRSKFGIKKYGLTLADNPLNLKKWLQHALEESLDFANYIQAAIYRIEQEEEANQNGDQ